VRYRNTIVSMRLPRDGESLTLPAGQRIVSVIMPSGDDSGEYLVQLEEEIPDE